MLKGAILALKRGEKRGVKKASLKRTILGHFLVKKGPKIGLIWPGAQKGPQNGQNGQIPETRVSSFTSPKIIHLLKGPGQSQSAASCSAISGRKVLSAKVGETGKSRISTSQKSV